MIRSNYCSFGLGKITVRSIFENSVTVAKLSKLGRQIAKSTAQRSPANLGGDPQNSWHERGSLVRCDLLFSSGGLRFGSLLQSSANPTDDSTHTGRERCRRHQLESLPAFCLHPSRSSSTSSHIDIMGNSSNPAHKAGVPRSGVYPSPTEQQQQHYHQQSSTIAAV